MKILPILKPLGIFVTSMFVLSTISWLLANVYVWICAPFTFWGWLSAPLSLGSPICQFINFSQYERLVIIIYHFGYLLVLVF